jgi:hypothetical protein
MHAPPQQNSISSFNFDSPPPNIPHSIPPAIGIGNPTREDITTNNPAAYTRLSPGEIPEENNEAHAPHNEALDMLGNHNTSGLKPIGLADSDTPDGELLDPINTFMEDALRPSTSFNPESTKLMPIFDMDAVKIEKLPEYDRLPTLDGLDRSHYKESDKPAGPSITVVPTNMPAPPAQPETLADATANLKGEELYQALKERMAQNPPPSMTSNTMPIVATPPPRRAGTMPIGIPKPPAVPFTLPENLIETNPLQDPALNPSIGATYGVAPLPHSSAVIPITDSLYNQSSQMGAGSSHHMPSSYEDLMNLADHSLVPPPNVQFNSSPSAWAPNSFSNPQNGGSATDLDGPSFNFSL